MCFGGVNETMSLLDSLINKRRSIRKYKADMPPDEWIDKMLQSALMAPSPSNSQPIRFIRISSSRAREDLRNAMVKGYQRLLKAAKTCDNSKRLKNRINIYWRFSEFMFDAPVLFAVGTVAHTGSFSKKLFEAKIVAEDTRGETDINITVGLALKGFLLKGEELGLGTCILSAPLVIASNTEKIFELKDIMIKCFVVAGFPGETPPPIERKKVSEIYSEI